MRPYLAIFLGVLVGLSPVPAFAWGGDGHRIVCAIAWDEMRQSTREHVMRLLGVDGREAFAGNCTWADDYRNHGHPQTASWHFVNVPPYATKVDLKRDCAGAKSCVVAQIEKNENELRSNAPDGQKAMALKFLAHFVGDVHQPLHISHADDKGGNDIKLRFIRRKSNLHAVWDTEMLKESRKPWQQTAKELERNITDKQRREWSASGPVAWADESLAITNAPSTEYAGHRVGSYLGVDYERRELPIVYERLSEAGVRLAKTLNEALR